MTKPVSPARRRPPIAMIDSEADALSDLAMQAAERNPVASALLLDEIDRAKLHSAARIPATVVTMWSTVEFVDEGSGSRRTVQLVYPADADISVGRISVLTPIGAGLIGLREGESILWPDRDGNHRKLSVVSVAQPAAAAP